MTIEQAPFKPYNLEKQVDSFTVRFNKEERRMLEADKEILEQSKDSTALKQLALIGHIVLHQSETGAIIRSIFKNKGKNKRSGVVDFD